MQLTIEILNDNALNLIYDLEKLNIIRLIRKGTDKEITPNTPLKPKKRFAGRISKATADDLQRQLKQSRDEWQF